MLTLPLEFPATQLRVIRGGGADARPLGCRADERPPAVRLRPGERPIWVALDLALDDIARIRAAARGAGMGADALMALAIEWMLVTADVPHAEQLLRPSVSEGQPRLAPTPALRGWIAHLGRHSEAVVDALPELLLPERLLARWRPEAANALRALECLPLAVALAAEKAAASVGLTLTEWTYRSALTYAFDDAGRS